MKTIILFTTLFAFLIALPVSAELTDADLDKIRLLILESEKRMREDVMKLRTEMAESEKRMREDIIALRTEMAESEKRIKAEMATLQIDVARLEGSVRSTEKMITWLMVLIVVVVTVPSGIAAWRSSRKDREQEKINQELREEIEILKRQHFSS